MKRPFVVADLEVPPGQRVWGKLDLEPGPDGRSVRTPFAVLNGPDEGTVLYVGGGTHGEELTGIEVARRLAVETDPGELRGALIVVPIQNVPSFVAAQYTTPWDGGDLGKSYPGHPEGSFTERMAHRLFHALMGRANVVIDVHSAMRWGEEYPQTIVISGRTHAAEVSERLARAFPVGAVVRVSYEQMPLHFGPAFARSIFAILHERGVPAVLVEIGEGGKLRRDYVDVGVHGVRNAMRVLEMLPGRPDEFPAAFLTDEILNVRSPAGGLLYVEASLGAHVKEGDVLARVVAVPDTEVLVHSPADGLVLRVMTAGLVVPGDRIVVLGLG